MLVLVLALAPWEESALFAGTELPRFLLLKQIGHSLNVCVDSFATVCTPPHLASLAEHSSADLW